MNAGRKKEKRGTPWRSPQRKVGTEELDLVNEPVTMEMRGNEQDWKLQVRGLFGE